MDSWNNMGSLGGDFNTCNSHGY